MKIQQRLLTAVLAAGLGVMYSSAIQAASEVTGSRAKTEWSMQVTGTIDVDAQGKVLSYTLDKEDNLSDAIRGLIKERVAQWRFEPTDLGTAQRWRNRMSMLLVAHAVDNERMGITLRGTNFRPMDEQDPASTIHSVKMTPPKYPKGAARVGGSGTVYLIVKVSRSGSVEDVMTEMVNLTVYGSGQQMKELREDFSKAAEKAAMTWTFQAPTRGDSVDDPYWLVRVPVDYKMWGQKETRYGEWAAYIPGERAQLKWTDPAASADDSDPVAPDALIAGDIYPTHVSGALKLHAPPDDA